MSSAFTVYALQSLTCDQDQDQFDFKVFAHSLSGYRQTPTATETYTMEEPYIEVGTEGPPTIIGEPEG